jgi:hypothetical protein
VPPVLSFLNWVVVVVRVVVVRFKLPVLTRVLVRTVVFTFGVVVTLGATLGALVRTVVVVVRVTVAAEASIGSPTANAATLMAVHRTARLDIIALHADSPTRRVPMG